MNVLNGSLQFILKQMVNSQINQLVFNEQQGILQRQRDCLFCMFLISTTFNTFYCTNVRIVTVGKLVQYVRMTKNDLIRC